MKIKAVSGYGAESTETSLLMDPANCSLHVFFSLFTLCNPLFSCHLKSHHSVLNVLPAYGLSFVFCSRASPLPFLFFHASCNTVYLSFCIIHSSHFRLHFLSLSDTITSISPFVLCLFHLILLFFSVPSISPPLPAKRVTYFLFRSTSLT